MEGAISMSSLLCSAAPDVTMAGAAAFAVFCGIVLMGGRSVVSRPLRLLSNLYSRSPRRVASNLTPCRVVADDQSNREMQDLSGPMQRAA